MKKSIGRYTTLFLFLLTPYIGETQDNVKSDFKFYYDNTPTFTQNSKPLLNAFAGGLNAPQFSTCHLNTDGIEDLVVFDRTAQKLSTFLAQKNVEGNYYWQYAPQYETNFPSISNWFLMVDYDHDGKKDIFTYTPSGIKVYQNTTVITPTWTLVKDPLQTTGFSGILNLYMPPSDIPSIVDIDNDGDYDIIVFDSSGNFALWHRNFSIENYKNASKLEFKRVGNCWGGFFKEYFDSAIFGQDCGDAIVGGSIPSAPSSQRVLHTGNTSLLLDLNGDGLKDLLFGHISSDHIGVMINKGTLNKANFTEAKYTFPSNAPINIPSFVATYYEDVDFDGLKDLLAAPNGYDNAQQTIDFQQSVWFYKNKGQDTAPDFSFQQTNFLQATMVDLGENTAPCFVDIDGDGDQDLFVGNSGNKTSTGYRASIYLYENKGNNNFELKTSDFLDIAKNQALTNVKPFISDVNGDGIDDFGFTANTTNGMAIKYIPNRGQKNKAFELTYAQIITLPKVEGLSNGDSPLLFDLDKDGKKDLLIGKSGGLLEFHKNTGTAQSPVFTLTKQALGGITSDYISGSLSLAIADLNGDGKTDLITGTGNGQLKVYKSITEQDQNRFLVDSSKVYNDVKGQSAITSIGGNLSITTADLTGDALPDLMIGNITGGLKFLKNATSLLVTGNEENLQTLIFPNPTSQYITIKNPPIGTYELLDYAGKTTFTKKNTTQNQELILDLSAQSAGIYFLRISENGQVSSTQKIVLVK